MSTTQYPTPGQHLAAADVPAGTLISDGLTVGAKLSDADFAAINQGDSIRDAILIQAADGALHMVGANQEVTVEDDSAVRDLTARIRATFPQIVVFLADPGGNIEYRGLSEDNAAAYAAISRIQQEEPRAALLTRPLQNAEQAEQWMRDMFAAGLGGHPDESGISLRVGRSDEPLFTDAEADRYDEQMVKVFWFVDPYAIAVEVVDAQMAADAAKQA